MKRMAFDADRRLGRCEREQDAEVERDQQANRAHPRPPQPDALLDAARELDPKRAVRSGLAGGPSAERAVERVGCERVLLDLACAGGRHLSSQRGGARELLAQRGKALGAEALDLLAHARRLDAAEVHA